MSPDATHRSSTKTYPRPSSDLARSAPPQRSRARQFPRAAVFSPRDESNCPAITGVETSIRFDSPLEGDGFELRFLVARPSNRHGKTRLLSRKGERICGELKVRIHLSPAKSQRRTMRVGASSALSCGSHDRRARTEDGCQR